jgi:RES domain
MRKAKPMDSFWQFAAKVRSERRWIFDKRTSAFIAAVRAASKSRERLLKPGLKLWRAQRGSALGVWPGDESGFEAEHPLPKKRMIPDSNFAREGGRANPPGLPYLYLASNEGVALAEMRPWIGESVTLGLFRVQKSLKIVVCKAPGEVKQDSDFVENPSAKNIESDVWNDISRAFSRPIDRGDMAFSYVPTQILAEAFKAEAFDGIAYGSSLATGNNFVLFDVHAAKLVTRFLYTLKRVRYEFSAAPHYGIYRKRNGVGRGLWEIRTESTN